ncbi:YqjF family protein [Halalkalicoccus ordinarius]|uniref:YqjF family protein n=1 Tax=Halalkalicoccus ordinarius TaxID=3116651 RepID=UPI00300EF356
MAVSLPLAFGWGHLLFANWPIDADRLDSHLPDALSVQTYDGVGWLTVVPFVNVDTRPRGLPAWTAFDVPELNLRTYVTHEGEPGVYFFSLDARSVATVLSARLFHRLPYYYARMDWRWTGERVEFASRRFHPGDRPARFEATYGPAGDPFTPEPGSRAAFLTERRRLYTQGTDGTVRHTDIDHEPWTLHPATTSIAENTLLEASGFDRPNVDPVCYYSPGLDVVTARSKRRGRSDGVLGRVAAARDRIGTRR